MLKYSPKDMAQKKVVLLYLLEKINMKLTGLQMTKIIMENNIMDYFSLQQYLEEISKDGYVSVESDDSATRYSISSKGKQVLEYFLGMIPVSVRNLIDEEIKSIRKQVRSETSVKADYIPQSENEYTVRLGIIEDDLNLIDLKITVGTRKDARMICENWKQHAQQMYMEIIENLTKKRNEESM